MKKNSITLVVTFGKVTPRILDETSIFIADFAFHLTAQDFLLEEFSPHPLEQLTRSNLECLVNLLPSKRKIRQLFLINLSDERINRVLDLLEESFEPDACIDVYGARLKSPTFGRLVDLAIWVTLNRCHLGGRWWNASNNARATSLSVYKCSGTKPRGQTANFKIWSLLVDEGVTHTDLARERRGWRPYGDPPETWSDFPSSLIQAFWTEELSDLTALDCHSIDFLANLPYFPKLTSISLSGSRTTPAVFEWIIKFSHLRSLSLSWKVEDRLPWMKLKSLKKLKSLDVTSSSLNDQQLSEILDNRSLRLVEIYYTEVSPASWPKLLAHPSLRSIWGSEHMSGEPPADYPETTNLIEFVALNARQEFFREFFARRYPHVDVVEM